MTTRHIRSAFAVVGTAALLAACGNGGSSGGSSASGGTSAAGDDLGLIKPGTIVGCADVPFPPFEVQDSSAPSGYSGFDIDLLQQIADKLDLKLEVQDVSFDALQSGTVLVAGQCDVAASAMTITEERKANLDFSDPYYDSLQSLLVAKDSGISSIDDLGGKTVGVQQGSTGKSFAEKNAPKDAKLSAFPSDGELWPALQAGQIDAILQDLPVNVEHTKDGNYEIVDKFDTEEQYGYAFEKGGKDALREAVNEQLKAMRDDGSYQKLYDSYFSTDN